MKRIKEGLANAGIPYVSECMGGNIEGLRMGGMYIVEHGSGEGYYFGNLEDSSDTCYTLQEVLELAKHEEETKMTWAEIMEKARHLALNSGIFTDDPKEKADNVYLVKDIKLVVEAFAKDIEEGKLGVYSEPASFLDKHGIEWE
jgi:hypothetical protein